MPRKQYVNRLKQVEELQAEVASLQAKLDTMTEQKMLDTELEQFRKDLCLVELTKHPRYWSSSTITVFRHYQHDYSKYAYLRKHLCELWSLTPELWLQYTGCKE